MLDWLTRAVGFTILTAGLSAPSAAVPVDGSLAPLLSAAICRAQAETSVAGVFHGMGVVTAIQTSTGALTLDHGDIKGLMPAMEMMYNVSSPQTSAGLAIGDKIAFDVDGRSYKILKVRKLAKAP